MNKVMKKLLCACLALAMLITILPPVTAQAAKTKSVVLYKGEVVEVSDNFYSTVKSVSSSKKAVVAAKKDSKRNYKAILTAKKAGKSTVTLKTKNGTFKYVVTVKNYDFTVSFKNIGNIITSFIHFFTLASKSLIHRIVILFLKLFVCKSVCPFL